MLLFPNSSCNDNYNYKYFLKRSLKSFRMFWITCNCRGLWMWRKCCIIAPQIHWYIFTMYSSTVFTLYQSKPRALYKNSYLGPYSISNKGFTQIQLKKRKINFKTKNCPYFSRKLFQIQKPEKCSAIVFPHCLQHFSFPENPTVYISILESQIFLWFLARLQNFIFNLGPTTVPDKSWYHFVAFPKIVRGMKPGNDIHLYKYLEAVQSVHNLTDITDLPCLF